MKKIIFIGGPTACGKTTLVNNLNKKISNSVKYRRYQGFFDIAKQKNISKNEIFNNITSSEVDDWFVNICSNSDIVISDVHYAVQMNRNSSNVDIYKKYVPTISENLIKKLLFANIQIFVVFLSCSPQECLRRAASRYVENRKEIRNISIEDAIIENVAEESEWINIVSTDLVEGLKLNSELFSVEELTVQILEYLKKCDEKKLKKSKIR